MTAGAATLPQHAGPRAVGVRLSVMMFLQYAVPGVWIPILARYLVAPAAEGGLAFSDTQVGMIMGLAGTVGALAAPLIVGQIADRYFSTQRVMAAMLIVTGASLLAAAQATTFWPWLGLSVLYAVMYTPTMMLSNSLAFSHMTDADVQFPRVRVWGTLGWVAVAWVFPMVWLQTDLAFTWKPPFLAGVERAGVTNLLVDAVTAGGLLAVVYGLYCLTLPHTPPKREAREPLALLKAFRLFRLRSFAVLMAAGFILLPIHQIYFLQTGPFLSRIGLRDADILPAMSLGQVGEIFMMVVLGMMLKRLGFKWVMVIGAAAYVLRYVIFGLTNVLPVWAIVAAQSLHGVCFGCFLAAAYIYVDRIADTDIRHSAQQVFGLVIGGTGPLIGGWLSGWLAGIFTPDGGLLAYEPFWLTLAVIGLAALGIMIVGFRSQAAPSAQLAGRSRS